MEGPNVLADVLGFAKVYSDGSIERVDLPTSPPSAEFSDGVASKDVVINSETGIWARIFLPQPQTAADEDNGKLPLIFYFHGGGFLFGSTAWSVIHTFLHKLCKTAKAVIVSVDYRLSPEHRLPVAYDDCVEAVEWVRIQAAGRWPGSGAEEEREEWLTSFADLSRCFLAGESAGGNLVHNVGMRVSARMDLWPLAVKGLIVIHPYFGGQERIPCEEEATGEQLVFLGLCDLMWKLCLPTGSDRDHPFCNALQAPLSDVQLPAVLVDLAGLDPLKDRGVMYFQYLKDSGKRAELVVEEVAVHGYHLFCPESQATHRILQRIAAFTKTHL